MRSFLNIVQKAAQVAYLVAPVVVMINVIPWELSAIQYNCGSVLNCFVHTNNGNYLSTVFYLENLMISCGAGYVLSECIDLCVGRILKGLNVVEHEPEILLVESAGLSRLKAYCARAARYVALTLPPLMIISGSKRELEASFDYPKIGITDLLTTCRAQYTIIDSMISCAMLILPEQIAWKDFLPCKSSGGDMVSCATTIFSEHLGRMQGIISDCTKDLYLATIGAAMLVELSPVIVAKCGHIVSSVAARIRGEGHIKTEKTS